MKFTPEVSAGAILQAVTVATMAMAYVFGVAGKSEESLRANAQLRSDVTSQIADLKGAMTAGLNSLQQQIATLPDQRAQISDLARRADHADQEFEAQGLRLTTLERNSAQLRSDLDSIMRASNQPPNRSRGQ